MNVCHRYKERYELQRKQLASCSEKEQWVSHIESRANELTNLIMAGLGLSTLILRLGAIIQMCQRLEADAANEDSHFMKVVLENLRETLPSDSNWKNIWYSSMKEGSKWADALEFDANNSSVLDRFVAFRNQFVHQLIQVSVDDSEKLWQGLQILDEMAQLSALFESGGLDLINRQYHWKENGGGCWNLHPFIQATVDDELPYVFQGLYENKVKAKYISAVHGKETPPHVAEDLDEAFRPMQRSKRERLFEIFDHRERMRYYHTCFVGRDRELNAVLRWTQERSSRSVLPIHSEAGMGKGALSAGIISELKENGIPVLFHFCHSGPGNNLMMVLFHFLLQGLKMPTMSGAKIWDTSDPDIHKRLNKLPSRYIEGVKLFQTLLTNHYAPPKRYQGQPLVVIIDGLDEAAVANSKFQIEDWFKLYNDLDEVIGDWTAPPWVKWIFTYRSMPGAAKGFVLDLPMPQHTSELVQPLAGLNELAVREALKPFEVGDAVIEAIMTRGSLEVQHPLSINRLSENRNECIDPTYLRTIFDQFNSGKLQADDPNALPEGLIGVYETLVPARMSMSERMRVLKFFTPWALLKNETSVELVASLLELSRGHVSSQIAIYSKWFVTTGSGKYQLYHDRFRLFLLQRVSASELSRCNDRIIAECEAAIRTRDDQEWERYGLEYLGAHLFTKAVMTGSPKKLREYALNRGFWERQSEVSGGYYWSEALLNTMLVWSSKFDANELVQIASYKLELSLLQQNASSKVIHALKENDLESVFQLLMGVGDEDQEGLERRFIMYIMCFLALIEEGALNEAGRRGALRALLEHFEAYMPTDIGKFDWNRILPSRLVCQIAFALKELDLDPSSFFDRAEIWNLEWIELEEGMVGEQLDFLTSVSMKIENKRGKVSALKSLSRAWTKIGDYESARVAIQSAFDVAHQMNWKHVQKSTIMELAVELADQGHFDHVQQSVSGLESADERDELLKGISIAFAKHARFDEAFSSSAGIQSGIERERAIESIVWEMVRHGAIERAVAEIQNRFENRDRELCNLAIRLTSIGDIEKALEMVSEIENSELLSLASSKVVSAMARQGKIDEAMSFASNSSLTMHDLLLLDPSDLSFRIEQALNESGIDGAYAFAKEIESNVLRTQALVQIARAANQQADLSRAKAILTEAVDLIRGDDWWTRVESLGLLIQELEEQGCFDEAQRVIQLAVSTADEIDNSFNQRIVYEMLFHAMALRGNTKQALFMLEERIGRSEALKSIASVLCGAENSKRLRSLLADFMDRSRAKVSIATQKRMLSDIADDFAQKGRKKDAVMLRLKAGDLEPILGETSRRQGMFKGIGHQLALSGKLNSILDGVVKSSADRGVRSEDYADLATDLAKHGNWLLAEQLASAIPELQMRQTCWSEIAQIAFEQGHLSHALSCASQLNSQESRLMFVRGLMPLVPIREFDEKLCLSLVPYIKVNAIILEQFIVRYAMRGLFFGGTQLSQLGRLEKLIDMSWAVNAQKELMNE